MADEFDIIAKYFSPLSGPEGLGLLDDAALLKPSAGYDLVITKDMLVENVHFRSEDSPEHVAMKALGVNLSDLAAKGAKPGSYFLGLALPEGVSGNWLASFAGGLQASQEKHGISLAGGDTVKSEAGLMVSITAVGEVPEGQMLRRSGSKAGDLVCVTGTLGDSAFGLKVLQQKIDGYEALVKRYLCPEPRLTFGGQIFGLAHASADVSDGLLADLGHICTASETGAVINFDKLPLSNEGERLLQSYPDWQQLVYSGGDDYELVFTVDADCMSRVQQISQDTGIDITVIGHITAESGVRLVDQDGKMLHVKEQGYQHFRKK